MFHHYCSGNTLLAYHISLHAAHISASHLFCFTKQLELTGIHIPSIINRVNVRASTNDLLGKDIFDTAGFICSTIIVGGSYGEITRSCCGDFIGEPCG